MNQAASGFRNELAGGLIIAFFVSMKPKPLAAPSKALTGQNQWVVCQIILSGWVQLEGSGTTIGFAATGYLLL
jgi:hypothetical protein